MCDNASTSIDYFKKHLELMQNLGQNVEYIEVDDINNFFQVSNKRIEQL